MNETPPDPTQLRFYSGSWVDVLKDAKHQYRLYLHTEAEEPFPERSHNSITEARDCLLEAIGKFQDEVKLPLDEGLSLSLSKELPNYFIDVFKVHCSEMDILVRTI